MFNLDPDVRHEWEGRLTQIKAINRSVWEYRLHASFTDHGPEHSDRLTDFIGKILDFVSGAPGFGLSPLERLPFEHRLLKLFRRDLYNYEMCSGFSRELQLLAAKLTFAIEAAAQLHDIGMQCTDTTIQRECGLALAGATPQHYTDEDRRLLRDNHHKLSEIWLRRAIEGPADEKTLSGRLSAVLKGLDAAVNDTIIDACKYHSKEDTDRCPEKRLFEEGMIESKAVALLIRVADELDISRKRVDIAQIGQLLLEPASEYWWWYHYLVKYIAIDPSGIRFYTSFNPDDEDLAKRTIEVLVTEFLRKNGKIIGQLGDHAINLIINPYYQPEPEINRSTFSIPGHIKDEIRRKL